MRKHEPTLARARPVRLRHSIHPSDWTQRFADCLLLLQPRTIAVTVARHVAATDPVAYKLEPEEAAARFMFEEHEVKAGEPH